MTKHSDKCKCNKCLNEVNELSKLLRVPPLRVTTRTRPFLLKIKKVSDTFQYFPEGASATIIANSTGLDRVFIQKNLKNIKTIKPKGHSGLWVPVLEAGDRGDRGDGGYRGERGDKKEIFNWETHNETLTSNIPNFKGKHFEEIIDLRIVKFKFIISLKGNASMQRMPVDGVELPLHITSMIFIIEKFISKIKEFSGYKSTDIEILIKATEFNRDYENLRLDGMTCLTYEDYLFQYRLYQKKNVLRFEKKNIKPIPAEPIIKEIVGSILSNKCNLEQQYELELIKSRLKELEAREIKNTGILNSINKYLKSNNNVEKSFKKKKVIKYTTSRTEIIEQTATISPPKPFQNIYAPYAKKDIPKDKLELALNYLFNRMMDLQEQQAERPHHNLQDNLKEKIRDEYEDYYF